MTPTARTLALLRKAGFLCAVVESWVPIPGKSVRRDLLGFADVLAVHPAQRTILLVQTTSLSNIASRLAKVRSTPAAATWLAAGGKIEVHGWDGSRLKRVEVLGPDLTAAVQVRPPRRGKRMEQGGLFGDG